MAEVTVSQFAEVLKVPVDRLLVQLDQAGSRSAAGVDQRRCEARATHAFAAQPWQRRGRRFTAQDHVEEKDAERVEACEVQGRARTVNVEVRRKRTYIKRDVLEEQARHSRRDRRQAPRGA